MTCLEEGESCLDIPESQENHTSRNAHYQTKATMHKWRRLTGAEVEHNHPPGQSKRMPSSYRVGKDVASSPILQSLRR